MGRIGLAIAPADPDIVYAIVEAARQDGRHLPLAPTAARPGRSAATTTGQAAVLQRDLSSTRKNADRVYSMDVFIQVSDDGGKTLRNARRAATSTSTTTRSGSTPTTPTTTCVGCDGGLYESFDRGATWQFIANLPITQFYDVAVDDARPVLQRLRRHAGQLHARRPVAHPQRARHHQRRLVRHPGRRRLPAAASTRGPEHRLRRVAVRRARALRPATGETRRHPAAAGAGRAAAALELGLAAHHQPALATRGSTSPPTALFRSDDRGDSWKPVSRDLTRQLDRNKLPVMGKVWGVGRGRQARLDLVLRQHRRARRVAARRRGCSTSAPTTAWSRSPRTAAQNWRKIEKFPGVPEQHLRRATSSPRSTTPTPSTPPSTTTRSATSSPTCCKSADRGKTWTSIAGDLPARGTVWPIAEDHVDPNLLFAGTEFGLFFTLDGGKKWIRLKGGLPTIAVRDLAIQKRENDLVVGTFGRGFYVLDDYTPLRGRDAERRSSSEARALPGARRRWLYIAAHAARPARQGVPGRGVLHRAQPAVRRRLHLLPEGRAQDAQEAAPGRREGGREEGRRRSPTRRARSCAPRSARRTRRSSSPSTTRRATSCAG